MFNRSPGLGTHKGERQNFDADHDNRSRDQRSRTTGKYLYFAARDSCCWPAKQTGPRSNWPAKNSSPVSTMVSSI